jgi:hypothetical protein
MLWMSCRLVPNCAILQRWSPGAPNGTTRSTLRTQTTTLSTKVWRNFKDILQCCVCPLHVVAIWDMTRYWLVYRRQRFREASLGYSRKSSWTLLKMEVTSSAYIRNTHGVMFRKPGILNRAKTLSNSCIYSSNVWGIYWWICNINMQNSSF